MKKKLPSIYKGNDYTHVNNNKYVFRSGEINKSYLASNSNKTFDSVYLINTPVIIETLDNKTIKSKIIGKLNDHILTSDNEIIKLINIKSIKKVDF